LDQGRYLPILHAGRQIRIDESDLLAYLHRDVGPTLSSGAVFPMSSELQEAVADAMAATGGAEAVPAAWRVFRQVDDSAERHSVGLDGEARKAPE
jgi:hypothetical protein